MVYNMDMLYNMCMLGVIKQCCMVCDNVDKLRTSHIQYNNKSTSGLHF